MESYFTGWKSNGRIYVNDSTDGSLVFYTNPGASTANSSYSRTELRELMDGGNEKANWTFAEGGRIRCVCESKYYDLEVTH